MRGWWRRRWTELARLARRAVREASSPRELALSVGLGVLVGASPLVGLHSVVALGAASALRLNRVGAFLGSNVSFGPIVVGLVWAEVRLGCAALGVAPLAGDDALALARSHLAAWWLGYALLGPLLASLSAALTWAAASAWQRRVSSASGRTSAPG